MKEHTQAINDMREFLQKLMAHFEHVLPAQAPISDFVHHNTLHGFQHLPFDKAIVEAREVLGIDGFLPEEQYREYYQQGRITAADLEKVLAKNTELEPEKIVLSSNDLRLSRKDFLLAGFCHPLSSARESKINWLIDEFNVLNDFHPDVSPENRARFLKRAEKNAGIAVHELWRACLSCLELEHYIQHPEELTDMSPEQVDKLLADLNASEQDRVQDQPMIHLLVRKDATRLLEISLAGIGNKKTMRGFLLSITGEDILDSIRPLLIRQMSNFLDQGIAAWKSKYQGQGFYKVWLENARNDISWLLDDLPEWRDVVEGLTDDPLDAIELSLRQIGVGEAHWSAYLERLALEIPGWSGMFFWRHLHPGYDGITGIDINITDYLAVRLVMERIFAQRLCRKYWRLEANIDMIRWYLRRHRSEFYVRYALYNSRLPEYLTDLASQHATRSDHPGSEYAQWKKLANMIWIWRNGPASEHSATYNVTHSAWPLFLVAQHLGMTASDVLGLEDEQLEQIFSCIRLDNDTRSFIWLQAYENHYRDQLFNAVVNNHKRGRWEKRDLRPSSQLVFCMDEREESIRRHLEEINPAIETLGAAGFFGVPINWQSIDDKSVTPLCPIVVTPMHNIYEQPKSGCDQLHNKHKQRVDQRLRLKDILHHEVRRNVFSSGMVILLSAPLALLNLVGKVFAPLITGNMVHNLREHFDLRVPTDVNITSNNIESTASVAEPQIGFTQREQVERIAGFLRTIGLTSGFAPIVVLAGHGSSSLNNPHLAAYDCGACSGRHGGPNARVFAAIANRPEVRAGLKEKGIIVPDDTWFVGSEHNTCGDSITWYDTDRIPEKFLGAFEQVQRELKTATQFSAHERCRRFASAPADPDLVTAHRHVVERSMDFSQARPELGHVTNAAAFIGRRSLSQGAFFDRRVFLISYDVTQDAAGTILENILLNVGPVGAGINLEYYFSTVNNDQYGCGTKVTHNITGLFGVMEGTTSDLRTGLPKQMIEIHEAMRLQVLVEASTQVLTDIYNRQPLLQELIGNGWLLLSVKDPHSDAIHVFDPGKGFVPWDGEVTSLPEVERSTDWYRGHDEPLVPVLIKKAAIS